MSSVISPARQDVPRPSGRDPVPLAALAQAPGDRLTGAAPDPGAVLVRGITAASGRVQPGDLFAGVPGARAHGAQFSAEAIGAGAVAVLTDPAGAALVPAGTPILLTDEVRAALGPMAARIYGQPSRSLAMLGVTGTSGKTTTTFLVRAGLVAAGVPSGLIGTVATMIGEQTLKTEFTTPEAPETQALLGVMVDRGVSAVAMEVSSHGLAMRRADGIAFEVGAFTNLSQDHLDYHRDMEDYFAAKAKLFDGRARTPIIMVDDEWGRRLAAMVGERAVTVSAAGRAGATWRAVDVTADALAGNRFRAVGPDLDFAAGCAVPGGYNVANALLALAILHAAGVDPARVAPAVAAALVPGRMERVDEGQPYLAVVDYSHKPAAIEGALRALRSVTRGRLIVVLGCGGDRDRGKRPLMGEAAARGAELLLVTDDNPRSEDPAAIRRAMLDGALAAPAGQRGEVREIDGRAAAIAAAVAAARPGDTVLIAGKGHELGQEIGGVTHPFDDRVELRGAIRAAGSGALA
ncbi:MAG: UDP-N-acetylmuramoyl-L-alanyl-D-glutamate--2,6-diaminopimelate ligase [Actinomycetia bacterium]|nr:UDP-N-acetylmuramoyl-L-alanyl-D-glutamate--2,6-diaminopimelate ligase [Actinomycetes bacterium]